MEEQLEYTEKVMDHFRNPRNVGQVKDADGTGRVGNPVCGDLMEIQIKVENNILKDVKFKTFGCGSAIATSSMITEMAIGKTLEEALKDHSRRGRRGTWRSSSHQDALLQPGS